MVTKPCPSYRVPMVHIPARASKDWRNNTADDRRPARALPGPSQIPLDLWNEFGPESGQAAHRVFKKPDFDVL